MKYLTITNLDKLKGKKIRATYRADTVEVEDSLVGIFTVYDVEDQEDWIWIVGKLNTDRWATDNTYIHFRLYKEMSDSGMVKVEKRYQFKHNVTLWGKVVTGEDWVHYIHVSNLQSVDTLCASLSISEWGWSKYVEVPTPPLSYKFGQP
jgi:hypothetical protein